MSEPSSLHAPIALIVAFLAWIVGSSLYDVWKAYTARREYVRWQQEFYERMDRRQRDVEDGNYRDHQQW